MKDVSDNNFTIIELYPKIYIYKNLFEDIERVYAMIKESENNNEDNYFNTWTDWSHFGKYLSPPAPGWESYLRDSRLEHHVAKTDLQKEQKALLVKLVDNFHLATKDYALKHNVDINKEHCIKHKPENEHDTYTDVWQISEMTICKYDRPAGMVYHSDFIRPEYDKPGYKFAITALTYFNDDYEGGEIDFTVNDKLIKYKPCAGDFVIFPSGHPDILTEDGKVYLHGVMPTTKGDKYFSRMYWTKYYSGSDEWHENEKKFGAEVWSKMYDEITKQRQIDYPQRHEITDAVRIQ